MIRDDCELAILLLIAHSDGRAWILSIQTDTECLPRTRVETHVRAALSYSQSRNIPQLPLGPALEYEVKSSIRQVLCDGSEQHLEAGQQYIQILFVI